MVRGSTGSLGKLTLQRDCGVSWRYRAFRYIIAFAPVLEQSAGSDECEGDLSPTTRATCAYEVIGHKLTAVEVSR